MTTQTVLNTNRKQSNHHADQGNRNKGTSGSNIANSKVHGNRSKQLKQNRK